MDGIHREGVLSKAGAEWSVGESLGVKEATLEQEGERRSWVGVKGRLCLSQRDPCPVLLVCWAGSGRAWPLLPWAGGFSSPHTDPCSFSVSDLPYGWEQETDEKGQVFFVE